MSSISGPEGILISRPMRITGVGHWSVRTSSYASVRAAGLQRRSASACAWIASRLAGCPRCSALGLRIVIAVRARGSAAPVLQLAPQVAQFVGHEPGPAQNTGAAAWQHVGCRVLAAGIVAGLRCPYGHTGVTRDRPEPFLPGGCGLRPARGLRRPRPARRVHRAYGRRLDLRGSRV